MADDTWWLDYGDLDARQREIIALPTDGSYLVLGPPGSGKTNLVLLRAAQLSRSGRSNVVILMFNRGLREFVLRGAANYQLGPEQIKTVAAWGRGFLQEQGVRIDDLPEELMDSRKEIAKRISNVLVRKPALKKSIECILVDEVQDCLPEEIEVFSQLATDLYATGDARQQIYETGDPLKTLKSVGCVEHKLQHHYRNGRNICKFSDSISHSLGEDQLLPACNYDEAANESKAEYIELKTDAEQLSAIVARVSQELKAYPGELIGIACPLRDDVETIRTNLATTEIGSNLIAPIDLATATGERRVLVGTLHELKGLEFRTLHLAHMEHVPRLRHLQKKVAFTAATRAKTILTVYVIGSGTPYLRQARDSVNGPPTPPDPRTLFPGTKNKKKRS